MSHFSKTITLVSLSVLLAACSTSNESKRQITDNENYLKAPDVKPLIAPAGVELPIKVGGFYIPAVETKGELGKALDIRPPLQPLPLIAGSRVAARGNQAEIHFDGSVTNLAGLVQSVLESKNYPLVSNGTDNSNLLYWNTDWVKMSRLDENYAYEGRYQVNAANTGYSNVVSVTLVELRHKDQVVTNPAEISRYTAMMLNSITDGIVTEMNKMSSQEASQQVGSFTVQSSTDETGLPIMLVYSSYDVVWQALPTALANAGMTITESNRANGLINVKYKPLSKSSLQDLTSSEVKLKAGEYALQVGDLASQTSLQFRSKKGKPVDKDENDSLVDLIQAVLNKAQ